MLRIGVINEQKDTFDDLICHFIDSVYTGLST